MWTRFVSLTEYFNYYSRIDKKMKLIHLILIIPRILLFFRIGEIRALKRLYRLNKFPTEPTFKDDTDLPKINLLIVVEKKDFELLPLSLGQLLQNSLNKISKVSIVTPFSQIKECEELLHPFRKKVMITFYSEDEVVNSKVREKIRNEFSDRYGWVLQQFATVAFIQNEKYSDSEPILALDADTCLTRPTAFINSKNEQILFTTTEFHQPYYDLIKKLSNDLCEERLSFIGHHMVYQPTMFRIIFNLLDIDTMEKLINFVLENYDKSTLSPICVEYEIYAQWMVKNNRKNVEILKFTNISVPRESFLTDPDFGKFSNFESISLHSYLS